MFTAVTMIINLNYAMNGDTESGGNKQSVSTEVKRNSQVESEEKNTFIYSVPQRELLPVSHPVGSTLLSQCRGRYMLVSPCSGNLVSLGR